jgi:hypothetical protein
VTADGAPASGRVLLGDVQVCSADDVPIGVGEVMLESVGG